MIRLKLLPRPEQLTDEMVAQLTDVFNSQKTAVWNQDFIKNGLLLMSFNKCCYCECKLDEESKYMEVEHFKPKRYYPQLVVTWENLLPSCKRCNLQKLDHDTGIEPIVNPVNDNPREHLKLRSYRFYGKTDLGKMTVEVLALNDRRRLQEPRFKIGSKVKEALDELENDTRVFQAGKFAERRLGLILNKLKNLLREAQLTEEYSTIVATEIIHEDSFHFVKNFLLEIERWDDECAELESTLLQIFFEI